MKILIIQNYFIQNWFKIQNSSFKIFVIFIITKKIDSNNKSEPIFFDKNWKNGPIKTVLSYNETVSNLTGAN